MLEVKDLSGGYGKKDIIQDISFSLHSGDVLGILGPNGCGKTTLFKLLLGFLPRSKGEIYIRGISTRKLTGKQLAHELAYIPQAHSPAFNYKVIDMVLLGRTAHIPFLATPGQEDYSLAASALCMLNIKNLAEKEYTKISGGERQLVLIARAICQQAKILIMDEPSANLDYANQQLVLHTVKSLARKGYTIIFSTHSPDQPFRLANKVLLVKNGKNQGFGPPEKVLTSKILKEIYGINIEIVKVKDSANQHHSLCLSV